MFGKFAKERSGPPALADCSGLRKFKGYPINNDSTATDQTRKGREINFPSRLGATAPEVFDLDPMDNQTSTTLCVGRIVDPNYSVIFSLSMLRERWTSLMFSY